MKGAVDRIERVVDIVERLNIPFYIHCDGALGGLLLPFIEDAPKISFKDYPIGSIAVSGHKFIGSPVPCGMVLARSEYVKKIETSIEYIGSTDTTIMGSRNGLAPLFIWYAINTRRNRFSKEVAACLQNARYLYHRLLQAGSSAMLNDFSNTVVFEKPEKELCHKWQLATQGDLAHVVVMQNFDQDKIDNFLDELLKDTILAA
jgi:histidine decarboxylase